MLPLLLYCQNFPGFGSENPTSREPLPPPSPRQIGTVGPIISYSLKTVLVFPSLSLLLFYFTGQAAGGILVSQPGLKSQPSSAV